MWHKQRAERHMAMKTACHGFCPGHGSSVIGQVYPGDSGCAGLPEEVVELLLEVTISSSLELDAAFPKISGGFLESRGEVLLETIGLDNNLHAGLEEGRRCGGGMEI